ncbi:hypothetical protein [Thalassotalea sediminis]|uniref:hypothetical protein n=1 Tax=Thalassotalea sediminis TaxID=1759089 RepID=UPI0025738132|nr:hypothetical protein [Thalassotalea sediminis]
MTVEYLATETPFAFRHHCWFCGEPCDKFFAFPQGNHYVPSCIHPPLTIPSCTECLRFANASKADNIWQVNVVVKNNLIKKYRNHLAIGINWTKQELEDSQFEHGNFASFQKSAWKMYEIARERVNFTGWRLEINGVKLEVEGAFAEQSYTFDGVTYPSIDRAIEHYATTFSLHKQYLRQVLSIVGIAQFSKAIRFCRLQINATPQERAQALRTLKQD